MLICHNFNLIPFEDFSVGADNRALQYGDGVFDSMICIAGRIRFFEDHFERLSSGAAALKLVMSESFNVANIEKAALETCLANGQSNSCRVKIIAFRKPGGLYGPVNNHFDFIITTAPFVPAADKRRFNVQFCTGAHVQFSKWSAYKTLSSLTYVMAAKERDELGADELILTDANGAIAECTSSNIFWMKHGVIYTPDLRTGCKEGILRKNLRQYFFEQHVQWLEVFKSKVDLQEADAVFAANASGIFPFLKIEERELNYSVYESGVLAGMSSVFEKDNNN
ncbi:MAG: aminotransferase class IV [Bacteroidota bacterium]